MDKFNAKRILPIIVFLVVIAFAAYSSLMSAERKKADREISAIKLAEQAAWQKDADLKEKNYLMGKFDPSKRDDFEPVPAKYNSAGYETYLRKETLSAFIAMAEEAREERVILTLVSATRNFDYQKNIWDDKWEGKTLEEGQNLAKSIPDGFERFEKILEYSSVPGTSRHHWGADIDINGVSLEYYDTPAGKKIYKWLTENAWKFGFCQTYTAKGPVRPTGYNEEKWHWSYLPLSRGFTQEYKRLVTSSDIKGFDGDQYTGQVDIIDDYVLGINSACL